MPMQLDVSREVYSTTRRAGMIRVTFKPKLYAFFAFSVLFLFLRAESQDVFPISIQVSKYGEDGGFGKVLIEIKNNTTLELTLPIKNILDGQVMLSVEDSKAKKGLQTSVSFFASKIANSPFGSFESQPAERLDEDLKIAPNSTARFKLDLSRQLERARREFPDEPVNLRIDFTRSFTGLEELNKIAGLKVRSNRFVFEKAAVK